MKDKIRKILLNEWDPIGINNPKVVQSDLDDEYDGYIDQIIKCAEHSAHELELFLQAVETQSMGLSRSRARDERRPLVVAKIVEAVRNETV